MRAADRASRVDVGGDLGAAAGVEFGAGGGVRCVTTI
jgi:hypothetical protein